MKIPDIAQKLQLTYRQVHHVIRRGHPTPQKSKGRPSILSKEQIDELEAYIRQSRQTRQMTFKALADGNLPSLILFKANNS